MKKVLAFVLSLVISIGICGPAFAEEYFSFNETEIPVLLTSEATLIDITVTPSMVVNVDKNGNCTCSEITCKNNNEFNIWISDAYVLLYGGWRADSDFEDEELENCGQKIFYVHYDGEKYDTNKSYGDNMEALDKEYLQVAGGKTEKIPFEILTKSTGKALKELEISGIEITFAAGTEHYELL